MFCPAITGLYCGSSLPTPRILLPPPGGCGIDLQSAEPSCYYLQLYPLGDQSWDSDPPLPGPPATAPCPSPGPKTLLYPVVPGLCYCRSPQHTHTHTHTLTHTHTRGQDHCPESQRCRPWFHRRWAQACPSDTNIPTIKNTSLSQDLCATVALQAPDPPTTAPLLH